MRNIVAAIGRPEGADKCAAAREVARALDFNRSERAFRDTEWNLARAAEALGVTFRSMRYNVKKYNLSRADDGRQKRAA